MILNLKTSYKLLVCIFMLVFCHYRLNLMDKPSVDETIAVSIALWAVYLLLFDPKTPTQPEEIDAYS